MLVFLPIDAGAARQRICRRRPPPRGLQAAGRVLLRNWPGCAVPYYAVPSSPPLPRAALPAPQAADAAGDRQPPHHASGAVFQQVRAVQAPACSMAWPPGLPPPPVCACALPASFLPTPAQPPCTPCFHPGPPAAARRRARRRLSCCLRSTARQVGGSVSAMPGGARQLPLGCRPRLPRPHARAPASALPVPPCLPAAPPQ